MVNIVICDGDKELSPRTRADNVLHGSITLSERLNDNHFILKDKATGSYKKISLSNGSFVLEDYNMPELGYSRVLAIGNSITLHEAVEGTWWGLWGMAATTREKDWVHVLQNKLRNYNTECVVDAINVANTFERKSDYQGLTSVLATPVKNTDENIVITDYDLIIIRMGENWGGDMSVFKSNLDLLLADVKNANPTAEIVVTGNVLAGSALRNALEASANDAGLTFVRVDGVAGNSVGDLVYGDDGQWHAITNSGVAGHPSDIGMAQIADKIYEVLKKVQH